MAQLLQALYASYNALLTGMAVIARLLIVAVFVMIIYDVTARTVGVGGPVWTVSLAEYSLLFATILGSPWLIRRKGHVFLTIVTGRVSAGARRRIEAAALVISALACLVFGYYATAVTLDLAERGVLDIRSVPVPAWLVVAPVPLCFLLMACEFIRYLVGNDSMYELDKQSPGSGI